MRAKRQKEFNEKASWLREGVLYHRGKHSEIVVENTMEAFQGAVDDNLGIEFDVRLTKDEIVVISHDDNLKRVYGVDKNISESTYEEINRLSKGKIPVFTEFLKFIDGRVPLMVEVKSLKVGKLEEKVVEILKNYKGKFVVVSFNPFCLRYFRKRAPEMIRGQLSYSYNKGNHGKIKKFILSRMLLNVYSRPHFISYGLEDVDLKLLAKWKKKGYFIIGWPYKDEKDKEKLSKVYDNMIMEFLNIKEF